MVLLYYNNSHSSQKVHGILFLFINVLYTFHLLRVVIAGAAYPLPRIVIFVIGVTIDPVPVLVVQAGQAAGRLLAVAEDTLVDDAGGKEINTCLYPQYPVLCQQHGQTLQNRICCIS